MSAFTSLATIDWISSALAGAGFDHDPGALAVQPRDGRVAVRLRDDRMAWFPVNEQGRATMLKERRVLRRLETHRHFSVPRIVFEDESGWDVRSIVPGVVDPVGCRDRILADPVFAAALGNDLGLALAEQHTRVPRIELEGWLPVVPNWPRAEDLPHVPFFVGDDPKLLARINSALRRLRKSHALWRNRSLSTQILACITSPSTRSVIGCREYSTTMTPHLATGTKILLT